MPSIGINADKSGGPKPSKMRASVSTSSIHAVVLRQLVSGAVYYSFLRLLGPVTFARTSPGSVPYTSSHTPMGALFFVVLSK